VATHLDADAVGVAAGGMLVYLGPTMPSSVFGINALIDGPTLRLMPDKKMSGSLEPR